MTLTANPNNYVLGRGRVYFGKFQTGLKIPGPFRYVGNTPELSIAVTPETLAHYSSEGGVKEVDDAVTLKTDRKMKLKTDNIDPDNVALFFLGSSAPLVVSSSTVTDEVIPGETVAKNGHFQLGYSSSKLMGNRDVASVVIKDTTGVTTYVAGTDYEVDLASGLGRVLSGGAIADGDDLKASYSIVAHTHDAMISGAVSIEGAMKFISDNPTGLNADFYLPYVRLSPDGDYMLKGDTWQELGFQGEVIKLGSNPAVLRAGAPYIA